MKILKIIGVVIGGLIACVVVFLALCFLVFWREPDPRETCENVARHSSNPKVGAIAVALKTTARRCWSQILNLSRDRWAAKAPGYGFPSKCGDSPPEWRLTSRCVGVGSKIWALWSHRPRRGLQREGKSTGGVNGGQVNSQETFPCARITFKQRLLMRASSSLRKAIRTA